MFGTVQKNWYKINEGLVFSTNFRYFSEHQIELVENFKDSTVTIMSIQDKKVLATIEVKKSGPFEDFNLKEKLIELHLNLIEGKIYEGKGEFVN